MFWKELSAAQILKLENVPRIVVMTILLTKVVFFQYSFCQILLGGFLCPGLKFFAIYLCHDMIYSICSVFFQESCGALPRALLWEVMLQYGIVRDIWAFWNHCSKEKKEKPGPRITQLFRLLLVLRLQSHLGTSSQLYTQQLCIIIYT